MFSSKFNTVNGKKILNLHEFQSLPNLDTVSLKGDKCIFLLTGRDDDQHVLLPGLSRPGQSARARGPNRRHRDKQAAQSGRLRVRGLRHERQRLDAREGAFCQ